MSLNASIEHDTTNHRGQKKRRGKVFNVKGNLSLSTSNLSMLSKPPRHDIEGTLEMQKMVLQGLARQENAVNGLSECESRSTSQTDLNNLKKEACMLLQDTWDRSGR